MMKKTIAWLALCGVLVSAVPTAAAASAAGTGTVAATADTAAEAQMILSYKAYRQQNNAIPEAAATEETDPSVEAAAFTAASADAGISVLDGYAGVAGPLLRWDTTDAGGTVTWRFTVRRTARYRVRLTYYALENSYSDISFGLRINGVYPFRSCEQLSVCKTWTNETQEFVTDARGDQKRPSAVQVMTWQSSFLQDSEGLTNDPYTFVFCEGENTVTLEGISMDVVLRSLTLEGVPAVPDHQTYLSACPSAQTENVAVQPIILQCEQTSARSHSSIAPMEDRSHADTTPSDPVYTRYNCIGDHNWQTQGQWIRWDFTVTTAGYYNIGMRVRQNYQRGYSSARRIYIDGAVPFTALLQVEFPYRRGWYMRTLGDGENDYAFYFEAGQHSITMEVIPGDTATLSGTLQESVAALNKIYRSVIMLTGTSPDPYRDYYLGDEIPDLIEDMTAQRDILQEQYNGLQNKYGGRDGDTATLQRLIVQLSAFIEDTDAIVEAIGSFSDNISSLSSWVVRLKEQPLKMDHIEIKPVGRSFTDTSVGFFGRVSYGLRQFIGSFVLDYNAVGGDTEAVGEPLDVWISLGRDQSQLIREMVDTDFSRTHGTPVSIKLSKGSVIQATFAGTGPDVVLFAAADQPVNLAVRGAVQEVSRLDPENALLSQFSEEELVAFRYGSGLYGVPLTADIHMMFVRTDIFGELGLTIPETWEQLGRLIPTLQRRNMNVGLPKVTIDGAGLSVFNALLLQGGQNYYNDDLSATAFGTETALEAFKDWTSYYTKYDVPIDYDFYNRFRSGEIPIGFESYTLYNKLAVAAPEIAGMWKMLPMPGTVQADGTVDRATSVNCSAALIMNNGCDTQAAWAFVSWFAGAEMQASYGRRLEALVGEAARYNTANLQAIRLLPWTPSEASLILTQMQAAKGIPQSIASYYVTRNLYNAYRRVTVNNTNPREVLYRYDRQMNEEIARKREEFGLQ